MPHKPADLRQTPEGAAPPELELLFRPMFGGIGVYAGGRMFCSLPDVGLALKLTGAGHEEFLKVRGWIMRPAAAVHLAPAKKTRKRRHNSPTR